MAAMVAFLKVLSHRQPDTPHAWTLTQIVKKKGSIILAAECREGIPENGEFDRLLKMAASPRELLQRINQGGSQVMDQWSAQVQALAQPKADIYLKSTYLNEEQIRSALLEPCQSIEGTVERLLNQYGRKARIAVLPEGPQTIPYVYDSRHSPSSN